jgi:C4-dicarboxylate transporter DctM subunit
MLKRIEEWFLVIFLSAMSLLGFYQVVTRYVFTSLSLTWIEELIRHLFVAISFIGAAVVTRKKEHPILEMLSEFLPHRIKPFHQLYADVCAVVFSMAASFTSFQLLLKQRTLHILTSGTRIPMYVLTIPIVLGFLLMTYYLVVDLIKVSRQLSKGKDEGQQ